MYRYVIKLYVLLIERIKHDILKLPCLMETNNPERTIVNLFPFLIAVWRMNDSCLIMSTLDWLLLCDHPDRPLSSFQGTHSGLQLCESYNVFFKVMGVAQCLCWQMCVHFGTLLI